MEEVGGEAVWVGGGGEERGRGGGDPFAAGGGEAVGPGEPGHW